MQHKYDVMQFYPAPNMNHFVYTCSLVPKPKITVIGVRLVHKQNCELTSRQYAQLAWSLPVVVGKAYEYHVDKSLQSAAYL